MLKADDSGHLHPSLVTSRVHWCIDLDDLEMAQGLKSETCDFSPFKQKTGEVDSAQRALQPPNTPCCVQ